MEIKKEKILTVKNLTVQYSLKKSPIIKNFNLEIALSGNIFTNVFAKVVFPHPEGPIMAK